MKTHASQVKYQIKCTTVHMITFQIACRQCERERENLCGYVQVCECIFELFYIYMCGKWRKIKRIHILELFSFFLLTVFALITDAVAAAAAAAATEVQRKCVNTYNARFFFFSSLMCVFCSVRCGMIRTKNKRRVK